MNEITRRTYIILGLSALFLISGAIFFFAHGGGWEAEEDTSILPSLPVSIGDESENDFILKNMPRPENFPFFTFKKGDTLLATGTCTDFYVATIIYPIEVDYRKNPSRFVYNNASPCVLRESFSQTIDLGLFPFEDGKEYYYIRAPQGEKDMWYDPY